MTFDEISSDRALPKSPESSKIKSDRPSGVSARTLAFQALRDLASENKRLSVRNLSELYALVFGAINKEVVNALRLAKFVAIVGSVFNVEVERNKTPFLLSIWLFGIEPVKDTQILKEHWLLGKHYWAGADPSEETIYCIDSVGLANLIERFSPEPLADLRQAAKAIEPLSDGELVELSYDIVLQRTFANGRPNIADVQEATSALVRDSLTKNLWTVRRRYGKKATTFAQLELPAIGSAPEKWIMPDFPRGEITCLKDGTIHPFVLYEACLLLQSSNLGLGRGNLNLVRLLSCRLMHAELALQWELRKASAVRGIERARIESLLDNDEPASTYLSPTSLRKMRELKRKVEELAVVSSSHVRDLLSKSPDLRNFLIQEHGKLRVCALPRSVGTMEGSMWNKDLIERARMTVHELESLRASYDDDRFVDVLSGGQGPIEPQAYEPACEESLRDGWESWTFRP